MNCRPPSLPITFLYDGILQRLTAVFQIPLTSAPVIILPPACSGISLQGGTHDLHNVSFRRAPLLGQGLWLIQSGNFSYKMDSRVTHQCSPKARPKSFLIERPLRYHANRYVCTCWTTGPIGYESHHQGPHNSNLECFTSALTQNTPIDVMDIAIKHLNIHHHRVQVRRQRTR